jgi:hypothetical protein
VADSTPFEARAGAFETPLEIDITGNGGERIVFPGWEYLPATAPNLRLVREAGPARAARAQK